MNGSQWLWYRTSPIKIILRIILTLGGYFLCLAPMAFTTGLQNSVSEEQVFVRAFVSQIFSAIVPYFLASFVAFGIIRFVCFKVGLDNQEARNAEFCTRAEYLKSIGLELADAPRVPTG